MRILFETGADSNFISNEFAISHGFNILPLAPPDIAAFKSVGGTIIPKHYVALRVSLPGLGSPEREISFRVIPAGRSEMRDAAILGARDIFKNGLLKSSTASLDLVEPIFEQQESDLTIAEQSDMPGINSPVVDQFSDSDHSSRSPRSSTMMSVMNPVSSKSSVEPRPIRKLIMDNLQSLENRIQDIETGIESVPSEASDGISRQDAIPSTFTLTKVREIAIKHIVREFTKDAELAVLYSDALARMSKDRFIRNHQRLLKSYFMKFRSQEKRSRNVKLFGFFEGLSSANLSLNKRARFWIPRQTYPS
jgi:hypothetical protein